MFCKPIYGTCIIVVFSNDTVYIGADTRIANINIAQQDTFFTTRSKIFEVNGCIGAAGGFSVFDQFNVDSMIINSLDIKGQLIDRMVNMRKNLVYQLQNFIRQINDTKSNKIRLLFSEKNKININVVVAGISQNKFIIYRVSIEIIKVRCSQFDLVWREQIFPTSSEYKKTAFYLGAKQAIDNFFSVNPTYSIYEHPIKSINDLIKIAINSDYFCGYPIEIIRITSNGIKWIQKYDK